MTDLELSLIDITDAELTAADDMLVNTDFGLDDDDLSIITEDLPLGWDDASTDAAMDAMDSYESNFEADLYDRGADIDPIDSGPMDYGYDDFGGMDVW